MSIPHLNDDELNLAVLGEDLPPEVAGHLAVCLDCRRRRDAFLAIVEMARGADPDETTRARVRERALAAWGATSSRHWVRWLAAAAAVLVALLVPLTQRSRQPQLAFDPEAVMEEVDRILARDPLTVLASEEVVEAVTSVQTQVVEGSTS
jgi:hypothetical protein